MYKSLKTKSLPAFTVQENLTIHKDFKSKEKNLVPSESGSPNGFNSATSGSPNGFKFTVAKSFSASSKKLSLLISSENKHTCQFTVVTVKHNYHSFMKYLKL